MSDAPDDYIAAVERAIVGVEITITRIEGNLWEVVFNPQLLPPQLHPPE